MSATGVPRKDGSRTVRAENDFYATPEWVTAPVVEHLIRAGLTMACTFVDPFAGDGAILRVLRKYTPMVRGYELEPSRVESCKQEGFDVEQCDSLRSFPYIDSRDVVVTNPPFSIAQEWLTEALEQRVMILGHTVMAVLLRLSFLESKSRSRLHEKHPAHVMVLPQRPSFTGKGTDSAAYAWFVWGDGREGEWSVLKAEKPKRERARKVSQSMTDGVR